MAIIPFKLNAEFFKNNPGTIPLILVFAIAGFFTRSFVESSDSRNQDCAEARKADAIYFHAEIAKRDSILEVKDTRLYELQQQLLISNGIIDKLPAKIDSINRENKTRKHK